MDTRNLKVMTRVDSSSQLGTGHIMRCLTLADALREKKVTVSFISRELPGNLNYFIENKGYKVYRLPNQKKTGVTTIKQKPIPFNSTLIGKQTQSKPEQF